MYNEISYLSDEVCGRFIGFAEGESSFTIKLDRRRNAYKCEFSIKLRSDDMEFLKLLKNIFRFGYMGYTDINHPKKNSSVYWITKSNNDCIVVMKIVDKYPLWSKKKNDYAIWRKAVIEKAKPYKKQNQLLLEYYYKKIREVRLYCKPKISIAKPIDNQLKLKVINL